MYKRIFYFIILFFILFSNVITSYADDEIEIVSTEEIDNSILEVSNEISKEPSLNARSAVILDRTSKQIIYGKDENSIRKMASTTKIMTAIIVIENSNLNDIVEVSKTAASIQGSRLGLKTGDKISINDLLYGLMLCSGNDAALALAQYIGGSIEGFSELMNKKAEDLNLTNTHFSTPHGLDNDDHYTTAYELALLTDYALQNPTFAKIVNTKSITVNINGYPKTLSNTNELLGYLNGVYGVKTGFTNGANRCLVTSCKRGDLDIICVVLGCDTKKFRTQDSVKLIEYANSNYEMVNIQEKIDDYFNNWYKDNKHKFVIDKAQYFDSISLHLSSLSTPVVPVNKEDIKNIQLNIFCEKTHFTAPLAENTIIGFLELKINENIKYTLEIINSTTIERKTFYNYFFELLEKCPFGDKDKIFV